MGGMTRRLALCATLLLGALSVPYAAAEAAPGAPCAPVPTKVRLAQPQAVAGERVTGWVAVSCAPGRPVGVALRSFRGATVPGTVTVPVGGRGARFAVTTVSSGPTGAGQISAIRGGVRVSAPFSVVAEPTGCEPVLTELSAPNRVHVFEVFMVQIQVSCRRPSGETVYLETSPNLQLERSSYVSLPAAESGPVSVAVRAFSTGDGLQPGWISARRADRLDAPPRVETVAVAPAMAAVRVPRSVYWDQERLLSVTLTGAAPPGGELVNVVSSRPEVVESTQVLVPAGARQAEVPLAVHEPSQDTDVVLTTRLGTQSLRRTTTVHRRPVYSGISMHLLSDPLQPLNSRDELLQFDVFVDRTTDFAGLWVDLTSDQPSVFAPRRVRILPGDSWGGTRLNLGPAPATTDVTVTATVEGHPGVVGSYAFTVHPGVASIEAPDVVVPGQAFTVTARMMGPADIDQEFWFHPNYAECEPPDRQLLAGATVMQATCTVLDHRPGLYSMSIWLDGDFNLGLPVRVVAR